MEIDSVELAKDLHDQCSLLIEKLKTQSPLIPKDYEQLIHILSLAKYEFYESSMED